MDLSPQFACAQIFAAQLELAGFPLILSAVIGSMCSYNI